ncbi:MAG: type I-MYXAN CRISPR-associated protein Cas6/Cmx6 [bacterium]
MLWQESTEASNYIVPDDIVDLSYRIECRELPIDHAWSLNAAIQEALPWIGTEPEAGIHSIHGASSGNGWERPPHLPDGLLQLSRRTRMYLRLPKHRLHDAQALVGLNLDLGGFHITVGESQIRALVPATTVFSRSVHSSNTDDEAIFEREVIDLLAQQEIKVSKMLCGLAHDLTTPESKLRVRSILLAELEPADSIALQQRGLGQNRRLGCGIFLPHKSLAAMGASQDRE